MNGIPQLLWEMAKAGLFAVGGGLATLPFFYDISGRTGWFSYGDIADMVAVSESTPGPMGINMATYVGFASFGVLGAILAPVALVLPSLIISIIISRILIRFRDSVFVDRLFYGLRAASLGLIIYAGLLVARLAFLNTEALDAGMGPGQVLRIGPIILAAAVAVLYSRFRLHPIIYIAGAAAVGIIFRF